MNKLGLKKRFSHSPTRPTDRDLARKILLSMERIKDDHGQPITIMGPRPPIGPSRGQLHAHYYHRPVWDVTAMVREMLKRGELKRVRLYGFGHSGRAGHTYFVPVQPAQPS